MTTRTWSDGIAAVTQDENTVTVQILGDVYRTVHSSNFDAYLGFLCEVEAELGKAQELSEMCAEMTAGLDVAEWGDVDY